MNPIISGFWPQWTVENEIGHGSFGSVYCISRDLFGRRSCSAMKVLRIPREPSEIRDLYAQGMSHSSIQDFFREQHDMLKDEISLMTELKSSANIVSIEDYYTEPNSDGFGWTFYIRMELLESLLDYRQHHDMTVREAVICARDIASALESCDNSHIIHRDVKPANIFRNRDGLFKLGDFGIAKQLDCTAGARSIIGTPNFEAPEVAFGRTYGHTADIYSLGLVLFILLNNGQRPFINPYAESVSYKEMQDANRRRLAGEPLTRPVNADAELAGILEKTCAYDAEKRYRHASELKDALNRWLFTHTEDNRITAQAQKESDSTTRSESEHTGPDESDSCGTFAGISFCKAGSSKNYTVSASAADSSGALMNPVTKSHLALTADTFRDFKHTLEHLLGRDLQELVMALPDGWSRSRKEETVHLARTAGFSTIRQVSQTAAFAAYYVSRDPSLENCLSLACHSDRVDAALYSISGRRLSKQGFALMKSRIRGVPITPLIAEAAGQAVAASGLTPDRVQSVISSGLPNLTDLLHSIFPDAKILSLPEHAGGLGALLASPWMNIFPAPPVDRLPYTLGFPDRTPAGIIPVIRQGAPLPAEGIIMLSPRADEQGRISVRILEEISADRRNPETVSEYIFQDRSFEPYQNRPLRLALNADPDGTLSLAATDLPTGRTLAPANMSIPNHFDPGTSRRR